MERSRSHLTRPFLRLSRDSLQRGRGLRAGLAGRQVLSWGGVSYCVVLKK